MIGRQMVISQDVEADYYHCLIEKTKIPSSIECMTGESENKSHFRVLKDQNVIFGAMLTLFLGVGCRSQMDWLTVSMLVKISCGQSP